MAEEALAELQRVSVNPFFSFSNVHLENHVTVSVLQDQNNTTIEKKKLLQKQSCFAWRLWRDHIRPRPLFVINKVIASHVAEFESPGNTLVTSATHPAQEQHHFPSMHMMQNHFYYGDTHNWSNSQK